MDAARLRLLDDQLGTSDLLFLIQPSAPLKSVAAQSRLLSD